MRNPPRRRRELWEGGWFMSDFQFLFTAWMVVWAVFFVYEVSVAKRIGHVREEIERLKQQLHD